MTNYLCSVALLRRGLADRIFSFCLLVFRADRHCGPARVLVRARVRRRTDLFPHGLVAFANARLEARM